MSDAQRNNVLAGVDDFTHVRCGLDDTMMAACAQLLDISRGKSCSLRDASEIKALEYIATPYRRVGSWP